MTGREALIHRSLASAYTCLGSSPFNLPRIMSLRAELGAVIKRADALAVRQIVDLKRGSTRPRLEALRVALREDHLMTISAEGNRLLKGMPGIREDLLVPHKRANNADLLKAADRILRTAERHAPVFRKAKFPTSFIADGRRAMKQLEAGIDAFAQQPRPRYSTATTEIGAVLAEGRELIHSIDNFLKSELRGDSALERWKNAKRIPKRVGRPKGKRRPPDDQQ